MHIYSKTLGFFFFKDQVTISSDRYQCHKIYYMMDKCYKTKGMHLCIVRGENFNLVKKKNACDLNYWGFHQLHYIAFFRKFKPVREYSSENNLNSSDGFQFESSILPPHSPLFFLPSEELTGLNMLMMYFWDKYLPHFIYFFTNRSLVIITEEDLNLKWPKEKLV